MPLAIAARHNMQEAIFAEHLGGVIYDGVWVGEKSSIPNVNGIRRELVERLKAIKAPVIRWPGGCFADSYDWEDGIGPRDQRPRRTNFWVDDSQARKLANDSVQKFEPNTFGTSEFVQFCKLSNAEPYVAANLRSLPALSFDQWVEYCNSPAHSTTYADVRAASGSPEPYNVRYWGIGNESWGCGGTFTPEEYSNEYRRYTAWVPRYGVDLRFVAGSKRKEWKGSSVVPSVLVPSGKSITVTPERRAYSICIAVSAALVRLPRSMKIVPPYCASRPKPGQRRTSALETKMHGVEAAYNKISR